MKWVVTFAGARDRYQTPLALAQGNRLEALVTDFYAPLDRAGWHSVPSGLERRLARRYAEGLPSRLVQGSWAAIVANQLRGGYPGDRILSERAGALAQQRGAGLLAYSYYGFHAFKTFGDQRRPKVLFQVHPHPASVRRLLNEELELVPSSKSSLLAEHELRLPETRRSELVQEPGMADYCIAASQFTRRTLLDNGVEPDRVFVVPYGVNIAATVRMQSRRFERFRVLFVGQKVQRKGLSYLLDAWSKLRLPNAELVLVGRGTRDEALLSQYAGIYRDVENVSDVELDALYRSADLFCMPSLVEGFGLVYLEALARGIPIIGTPNTGAAELITHGREGFIVPIRDAEALAHYIEWGYSHRAELDDMRGLALKVAQKYSWHRFRDSLTEAIIKIENASDERSAERFGDKSRKPL
jgi:glycosyltransferase involved in cell wall biosynthesis